MLVKDLIDLVEKLVFSRTNTFWICTGLATAIAFYIYYVWYRLVSRQGIPDSIPWARHSDNIWQRAKISLGSLLGLRSLLEEGYEKFSKIEQPFVLPNIVTGHEVILPPSQMRWLLDQHDEVLSQYDFSISFLCAEYTMFHPKIFGEEIMGDFIRRNLTRDLDVFAGPIVNEIEDSLEDLWGKDTTKFREISVYNVMLEIIGRLVNRVLVGASLCRDARYLQSSTAFAQYLIVFGGIISLYPKWLRPFVGPFWTMYDKYQFWKLQRQLSKIVKERIQTFEDSMVLGKPNQTQPNDFIHWSLVEAYRSGDASEKTVDMITKRLGVLSFAAIQSSAITITNALFDIAASPDSITVQETLRAEANKTGIGAPTQNPRAWARSSLAQMTYTDSVLRESLRMSPFVSHGVTKVVRAKGGITLPSGHHLPQGSKCGIASYGPHYDDRVYSDPHTWSPSRFYEKVDSDNKTAPKSFVTTSEHLMGFSHGKHACPGRFFASQQLKLLLAHIALHYDIEPTETREPNQWLNNSIGPPIAAKLRVRRRPAVGGLEEKSGRAFL